MADDHGTTADDAADFAEHESTYEGFIKATEITLFYVLSIVLLLLASYWFFERVLGRVWLRGWLG